MINALFEGFADGFKRLIDRHRSDVRKEVKKWLFHKRALQRDPNYNGAFQLLIELILSRGWNWRFMDRLERFEREVDRSQWNPNFLGSPKGSNVIRRFRVDKQIQALLSQLEKRTIKRWTKEVHHAATQRKEGKLIEGIENFGPKCIDNYLRDMGYFDRIPIDVHERRFLIRTGIFHCCSKASSDPQDYYALHEALSSFCQQHLAGSTLAGIDLADSPGIMDGIIWKHCSKKEENICGKDPKCFDDPNVCPLFQKACLWSILKTHPPRQRRK